MPEECIVLHADQFNDSISVFSPSSVFDPSSLPSRWLATPHPQDAETSGRLLIVLASALKLDEKSGANIPGKYAAQSEAAATKPIGGGGGGIAGAATGSSATGTGTGTGASSGTSASSTGSASSGSGTATGIAAVVDSAMDTADEASSSSAASSPSSSAELDDFVDVLDMPLPDTDSSSSSSSISATSSAGSSSASNVATVESESALTRARSFYDVLWSLQSSFAEPNSLANEVGCCKPCNAFSLFFHLSCFRFDCLCVCIPLFLSALSDIWRFLCLSVTLPISPSPVYIFLHSSFLLFGMFFVYRSLTTIIRRR
jgi:hypothetical protein